MNFLICVNSILIVVFQIHLGLVLEELSHQTGLAVLTNMFVSSFGLYLGQKITIKAIKPIFALIIPIIIGTYAFYLFNPIAIGLFINKYIIAYYILLFVYSLASGRLTKYIFSDGNDVSINYFKLNLTILISTLLFIFGMIFFETAVICILLLLLMIMLYKLSASKLDDKDNHSLNPAKVDIYRLVIGGAVTSFSIYLILRYTYLYFFPIGFEYFIYILVFMLIYAIPTQFIHKVRNSERLSNHLWVMSIVLLLALIVSIPYLISAITTIGFKEVNYIFLVVIVISALYMTVLPSSITLPVFAKDSKNSYFEWSLLGNIFGCISSVILLNFLDVNLAYIIFVVAALVISRTLNLINKSTMVIIFILFIAIYPFSKSDRKIIEAGQLLRDGHRDVLFTGDVEWSFTTKILNHNFLSVAHYTVNDKDEFWGNGAYTSKIFGKHFQDKRKYLNELRPYLNSEKQKILIMGAGNLILLSDILNNYNGAEVIVVDSFQAYQNKDFMQFWMDRADIKDQDSFEFIGKDILKFLAENRIQFDLIVNNLTHPNYSTSSKVFTEEFALNVSNSLAKKGIYYNNSFNNDLDCSFDKAFFNKYEVGLGNRFLIYTDQEISKFRLMEKCQSKELYLFNNFKRRFDVLAKYISRGSV